MEKAAFRKIRVIFLALTLVVAGAVLLAGSLDDGKKPSEVSTAPSASLGVSGEEVSVTRVIDGDTIEIEGGQSVRYIGIDTPETVDPRRPVGCFGKEAGEENKRLVGGKEVILVKDVSDTDQFGRLLRYVYVSKDNVTVFVNDHLVRQGYARASTYPPDVRFTEQFLQAEREAREKNLGLWQKCDQNV